MQRMEEGIYAPKKMYPGEKHRRPVFVHEKNISPTWDNFFQTKVGGNGNGKAGEHVAPFVANGNEPQIEVVSENMGVPNLNENPTNSVDQTQTVETPAERFKRLTKGEDLVGGLNGHEPQTEVASVNEIPVAPTQDKERFEEQRAQYHASRPETAAGAVNPTPITETTNPAHEQSVWEKAQEAGRLRRREGTTGLVVSILRIVDTVDGIINDPDVSNEVKSGLGNYVQEQEKQFFESISKLGNEAAQGIDKGVENTKNRINNLFARAKSFAARVVSAPAEAVYGRTVKVTDRIDKGLSSRAANLVELVGNVTGNILERTQDVTNGLAKVSLGMAEIAIGVVNRDSAVSNEAIKLARWALKVRDEAGDSMEEAAQLIDAANGIRRGSTDRSWRRGVSWADFKKNRADFISNPGNYLRN